MDFPITIEDQTGLNALISSRLQREKDKQSSLEAQVTALTQERDALTQSVSDLTSRAETAEQNVAERDAADARAKLVTDLTSELEIPAEKATAFTAALRGDTEEELRAHADTLKPLFTTTEPADGKAPTAPFVFSAAQTPNDPAPSDLEQFAESLFGGGN